MSSEPTSAGRGAEVANPAAQAKKASVDLMPRILSALVLVPVALGLTWWGVIPFAGLVLAVALVMTWEWSRVVRGTGIDVVCVIQGITAALAAGLGATGYSAMGVVAVLVGAIIVIPLRLGHGARLSALGIFYAALPVVALLWLREDETYGFLAVLYLFVVVWTTDIAAFAAGRTIGGPKLWPRVSPNKTWAGLIGGVGTAALAGALFGLAINAPPLRLGVLALGLGLVAQAGDLAKSSLKRSFGVKDSSGLIPGHGGFMDRMDPIVTVSVAAALLGLLINMRVPAKALLFGA